MQLTDFKDLPGTGRRNWGSLALFSCLFVVFMALIALPAHAQYGASIQGTVADSAGSMIPGAHITLLEKDTNRKAETTADGAGNFFFGGLAPSIYSVTINHDGFKTKVIDNYKIIADQANGINVKLEVGGATTTVTVNASDQALIDTETGSIGGTISQAEIAKLPSFGRDVFQLVQLAPGMFGDGSQSGGGGTNGMPGNNQGGSGAADGIFKTENGSQVSAAGGRMNTNGVSLDGVAITSVTWGGAAIITPNEDTIKEFKVVSNPYDAEEGRTSGAQIKITSQNGTNSYHGSLFFKRDSPGMNAYQRWNPGGPNAAQRDNQQFNQYGGTVGAPIWRNKIFGFFGYEAIRNNSVNHPAGWYETPTLDGSGPTGSIANQFLTIKGAAPVYRAILEGASDGNDCAKINLVQGVTCNFIQGQGLDLGSPLTSGLGNQDPSYGGLNAGVYTPGVGSGFDGNADFMFLSANNPSTTVETQYNGRLDFQITSKDLVAASLYYVPVTSTNLNGASRDYNIFNHKALNYSIGALWDHTFNSHIINQARADMAGWRWNELKDNPQSPLGLPDAIISNYQIGSTEGTMNNQNSFNQLFGPSLGSEFDQWTLNFKDVATWAHKTHNIKFGGNVTRLAYLDLPDWQAQPGYDFNNIWDFLNDAPNTESVTSDPRTGIPTPFRKDNRQMVYGFFAQDDWKAKPNLTLNLGLRWEYLPGMTEQKGEVPSYRLGSGANLLTDSFIQLNAPLFQVSKLNFGPQVGFAWAPLRDHGRLVLHGGFGIGFDGLEMAITTNNRFNPPFAYNAPNLFRSDVVGANNPHLLYATGSSPYAPFTFPANTSVITTFNSALLPVNGANGVTGFPSTMPTAYVMRYSLNGQYDLGHQWVATLGYQGSTGRHLPIQYNLLNKLAPQLLSGLAVNPLVNNIDWYEDSGNSSFNALLGEIRHQMSHGVELDAQYRWAKSIDNGSSPYAETDYQFLPGYDKGPSDFDSRNMFKIYGLWAPTIFHNADSIGEKLLGNWTLSGILNMHSGFPYEPTFGGIACNAVFQGSGNCNLRAANFAGGAGTSQNSSVFKTGNGNFPGGGTKYFTAPLVDNNGPTWNSNAGPQGPFTAIPQAPGIGKNAFYGPHYFDVDMTVTKGFVLPPMKVLGEGARFEIRANAYNLFNKLNLSNNGIDTNITDGTFGRDTNSNSGVLGSRMIELEAHFKF